MHTATADTASPHACGRRKKKSVIPENITVSDDADALEQVERRSGRRLPPQFFVGAAYPGGFDALFGLDKSGEPNQLLAGV
jgi:hypothetical protein